MFTVHSGAILRSDGAWIPFDERNADYRDYLAWLADGNTPESPSITIPELVSKVLDEARTRRADFLRIADGLQLSAIVGQRAEEAQLIETIKQGLRDITKLPLADAQDYETMRRMVLARYKQLTDSAPSALKAAFLEALS